MFQTLKSEYSAHILYYISEYAGLLLTNTAILVDDNRKRVVFGGVALAPPSLPKQESKSTGS